ncbi:MAG: putative lipid II flippase FtsW [Alphaproteobacteria bacterium MarineAlpha5_Bin6]|nr:MAG: putative lipid II flippase FtsW [Alphaproteobacteria bacterium MarineAlpha5_Bin7]PPR54460.1 MAG: putative lipid II flippase FtsW [Alphaproteobacteria bacterium MarineAlpha5_Bin6]|tara:strand:- start:1908 stop:2963 length:1056 start_codon:yes stop_codon:yes gene_type:complete
MSKYLSNWWNEIDKFNFLIIITIVTIGIILSISINTEFSFFNKHILYASLAIVIMILISSLNEKIIRRLSLLGLIFFIIMLISILFLDYEIKGSKRWLKFFGLSIQPSEFIKPFFLILSAWFLSKGIQGKKIYLNILFLFFFLVAGLIILQPDFGMTFLFAASFFCQLFIAGLSISLVIIFFAILIILSITCYFIFDHVQKRINAFFDPTTADTYQIDLSLQAFKSGGLLGKGPAHGIIKDKIPDANTDFIFAVAGEELGFIFCSLIILLIIILIARFLLQLLKFKEPYIIIAIVGLISSYGLQSLINIFSALGVIPTKGMTLPFISYGGSSMISSAILFGFLLSLTKQKK